MHALVFDGKVIQLEEDTFPAPPEYTWYDVSGINPRPEVGWECDGGVFRITPPSVPNIYTIKSEAFRRIVDEYPDWKQRNMAARGVELQDVWHKSGSWTDAETAEFVQIKSAWDWITATRSASDALEGTLPLDFDNDAYWPDAVG